MLRFITFSDRGLSDSVTTAPSTGGMLPYHSAVVPQPHGGFGENPHRLVALWRPWHQLTLIRCVINFDQSQHKRQNQDLWGPLHPRNADVPEGESVPPALPSRLPLSPTGIVPHHQPGRLQPRGLHTNHSWSRECHEAAAWSSHHATLFHYFLHALPDHGETCPVRRWTKSPFMRNSLTPLRQNE